MNIDGYTFEVGGWETFPLHIKHAWSLVKYYEHWDVSHACTYLDVNGMSLRETIEIPDIDSNIIVYNYTKENQPFDWNRINPSVPLPCYEVKQMNTVTFFHTNTHWVYIKSCIFVGETNIMKHTPGRYSQSGPSEVSFFTPLGTDYPNVYPTLKLSSKKDPPVAHIRQGLNDIHCPHVYLDVPSYSIHHWKGRYCYREPC